MSPSSPERAASSPRPCFLGLTVKDPGHLAGDTSPPFASRRSGERGRGVPRTPVWDARHHPGSRALLQA